ncbi:MAG: gfo/Idh/MocA family oxidoreductase [Chloroflexi bacterium]|nr:MAG: gfo/Idh/MocA family oxidoreductase [Chloroflexota bacterium]
MDEIRWGMIGCGDVAERKSGPAFNLVPHSRLVAVTGRNLERVKDYARRHGIPKWHPDGEKLINDPEIDAIYIATPPDSHASYTLQAARAGKPVYVEKPMARTLAECQAMVAACAKAGVPLFVAYYRRCLPAFLKIKELVDGGAIGAVRCVTARLFYPPRPEDVAHAELPWRVRPEISGGGYLYDLASHQIDYLDFLFGPFTSITSQFTNQAGWYSPEDIIAAAWTHSSGVIGSGTWCFSAGQRLDEAEIIGSAGRITFSFFEQAPVRLETDAGAEEYLYPRRDPIQQPLIELVVDELRGAKGLCPSTGETGARTNWVLEQIVKK